MRAIFTVTNDIFTDQRVNKMARTLHGMGFRVKIVGVKRRNSPPFSPEYAGIRRLHLLFHKKIFFYAEYNIKLFFYLLFQKADLLVANDLDTLLPVHLVAWLRKKPVIYDTHEYFTGAPEVAGRAPVFFFWKWLEDRLFKRQKIIITVNGSIAELYRQKYGKKLFVVRNMPPYREPQQPPPRASLDLPEGKDIILLQGSGINVDRGAEELIQAMLPRHGVENAVLVIIGGGNVIDVLKKMVKREQLEEKVRFYPRMPYERLMDYTRHASIGVSMDKDSSLNYRFSLPNKLFDYIMAGVPVLASDLPEVSRIINTYQCGRIAQNHKPEHIAACIREMLADREQLSHWKSNCLQAAKELNWEKEEETVREIYRKFMK
jgi:glycosyltransferase involved in cell wall biosynthesis